MTPAATEHFYNPIVYFENTHPVAVEPSPKWIRAYFNGVTIADSRNVLLLREKGHTPVYYFPRDDVRMDLLKQTQHSTHCPFKGDAVYWSVEVGDRMAENVVWGYPEATDEGPDLSSYIAFYFDAMDHWFEEDEEIFVHPRDPYTRIDVLPSSRNIKIEIEGTVVAESDHPTLLFETGLPVRHYLPLQDVRLDMLLRSDTITRCPYKGEARYYSVQINGEITEDIAWYYPYPTEEASGIENTVCFYDERVDTYVEGELQERPASPFSTH